MDRIFLITVSDIKAVTGLHNNVDDKLVAPEIEVAQDIHIQPLLGSALFNRLLEGKQANSLTAGEQALIDKYIAKCLVYYTLSELPQGLSLQFYNLGIVRKTTNNTDGPTMEDLIKVHKHYKGRAEYYGERLVKYLQGTANASIYPEYLECNGNAISPADGDYDCGLVL